MTSALQSLWRTARKLGRPGAGRKAPPPLLFFTDPRRTLDPARVVERMPRGSGVVFRAFGAPDALARGRVLRRVAHRRGVRFLVGADAALAVALGADGVHLPERLAHRRGLVAALRPRFLVTGAAHDPAAIRRARLAGVDAIVLSPVFPSTSPSAGRPLGVRRFAVWARAAGAPVYALGGVDARRARRLATSGAAGLAVVSALTDD